MSYKYMTTGNQPLLDQNENPYQYKTEEHLENPYNNQEYQLQSQDVSKVVYIQVKPNTGETDTCNACCCLKWIGGLMAVNFILGIIIAISRS